MDYKPSLATLVEDLEVQRNYYKQEVDNLYIYLNRRGLSDDEIDEIAQGEVFAMCKAPRTEDECFEDMNKYIKENEKWNTGI